MRVPTLLCAAVDDDQLDHVIQIDLDHVDAVAKRVEARRTRRLSLPRVAEFALK